MKSQTKGLLISIEGADFVGKTTTIKNLENKLNNGIKFSKFNGICFTREPGGTEYAEEIRKIIFNQKKFCLSSISMALLFISARCNHIDDFIKPNLEKNKIVILDRYVDSTAVYQGYLNNISFKTIFKLNNITTNKLMPNITFYLKADIDTIKQRSKNNQKNNFDELCLQQISTVVEGFDKLSKKYKKRIVVIDANRTVDEITDQIIENIKKYEKRIK